MATINVKLDFLYLVGVIQHTSSIEQTLKKCFKLSKPWWRIGSFILFVDTSNDNIRTYKTNYEKGTKEISLVFLILSSSHLYVKESWSRVRLYECCTYSL